MFANRYTAFIDACTLASVLRRNLLLTLAAAEFFRVRWSAAVLTETEAAITKMLLRKGREPAEAAALAAKAIASMRDAFEEAEVTDFEHLASACNGLPDPDDAHVIAAALKTQAAAIVTENLKNFPTHHLAPLNIEARSADDFIADTVRRREARPMRRPPGILTDRKVREQKTCTTRPRYRFLPRERIGD